MYRLLSLTLVTAVLLGCQESASSPDQSIRTDGSDPAAALTDIDEGAVYSMNNERSDNRIVMLRRGSDGMLTPGGSFSTGGKGSGSFEDAANGLVLGSSQGEAAPNNLINEGRLLFAVNAGSNSISVFRVSKTGLALVDVESSGGEKPVSLTVNRGLLYVLNSGEFIDDLFDPAGNAIPNCTTGNLPSVTGFRVSVDGQLTPIPNSTRQLSGDSFSGCAQLSFAPAGHVLVVTERTAVDPPSANDRLPPGDEGLIVTFAVNGDGTLGQKQMIDATGQGPFGFTFNKSGALFTTEQFDGSFGPGLGAAAGYSVHADGSLTAASGSIQNDGTDTCWFVLTDDGKYGYTTSFFGSGRISSYLLQQNGGLSLLNAKAANVEVNQGASDMALTRNSQYLYMLNSIEGTVTGFRLNADGSLTLIQKIQVHVPNPMFAPMGLSAR